MSFIYSAQLRVGDPLLLFNRASHPRPRAPHLYQQARKEPRPDHKRLLPSDRSTAPLPALVLNYGMIDFKLYTAAIHPRWMAAFYIERKKQRYPKTFVLSSGI